MRRDGVIELVGDRTPELAGISVPVFGIDGVLLGALTPTLPISRRNPASWPRCAVRRRA